MIHHIDQDFISFILTCITIPLILIATLGYYLPRLNTNKRNVWCMVVIVTMLIMLSPIAGYFFRNSKPEGDFLASIGLGIIVAMYCIALLERRIHYALLNDKEAFEALYSPINQSDKHLSARNKIWVRFYAYFIVLMWYGGIISLIYAIIMRLLGFDFDVALPPLVVCGAMLVIYLGVLRMLLKCQNCHLNLYEMKSRGRKKDYVEMGLNVIFNHYFICMHCNARFNLKDDIDLNKLNNNYQANYVDT